MKKMLFAVLILLLLFAFVSAIAGENKYIGVKMCGICHKTDKQGKQLDIWQKSKHASAYKTLTTKEAEEIAKKKELKKPAAESPECLECHTTTATNVDKGFNVQDGVQCETCHGAGSGYKTVMKDKAKSIAAGLKEYKNNETIEAQCKTCHNSKSPTFKEFKFDEMWAKIKHPVPKG
jgi:hypothetical protein